MVFSVLNFILYIRYSNILHISGVLTFAFQYIEFLFIVLDPQLGRFKNDKYDLVTSPEFEKLKTFRIFAHVHTVEIKTQYIEEKYNISLFSIYLIYRQLYEIRIEFANSARCVESKGLRI